MVSRKCLKVMGASSRRCLRQPPSACNADALSLVSLFAHDQRTLFAPWDGTRGSGSGCGRSSLVDWPVYPRLAHTMRASNDAQCRGG